PLPGRTLRRVAPPRAVQRHLEVLELRPRARRHLRPHDRPAVGRMAILDAPALLSRRHHPATARDHGAQAHRAWDQADGVSAPRRFRALIPLLLTREWLYHDLHADPQRERPAAGSAGRAQRAVRIVPLLRVADR